MSPKHDYYLPTRRLVSQEDAAIIERPNVPRSRFEGTWTRKTSFDAGKLIPIMVDEVLPGDHLTYNVTAYVRLSTPLFPILDNQRIDTFFFFVPARLLWNKWVTFMGEQRNTDDNIYNEIPVIQLDPAESFTGSIYDHFGLPDLNQLTQQTNINALPFRAYNQIYNAWFRDQNLINMRNDQIDDGPDDATDYVLLNRAKSHDYFTSALPWPQKFTAPTIPLGGLAPIKGIAVSEGASPPGGPGPGLGVFQTDDTVSQNWPWAFDNSSPAAQIFVKMESGAGTGAANTPQIFADLAAVSGVAINVFRQAFLVQQLLERDARGGTRYIELVKSHFGVTSPDFRHQRPEYIGGGQSQLQITPVAQTAPTEDLPVGALGAAGTAVGQHKASYAATEHGYIIGLINVRSELSYQQGIHRMWTRSTRYDFYWPSLAGLGEQAILRKELYATGNPAVDTLVFGYQERWHEYRTRYSEVTGMLRSTATLPMDAWHLAQRFTAPPTLGQTFIEDTPPMARVLAAGALAEKQNYIADIMFHRTAVRPVPTFGTPVTLGRF